MVRIQWSKSLINRWHWNNLLHNPLGLSKPQGAYILRGKYNRRGSPGILPWEWGSCRLATALSCIREPSLDLITQRHYQVSAAKDVTCKEEVAWCFIFGDSEDQVEWEEAMHARRDYSASGRKEGRLSQNPSFQRSSKTNNWPRFWWACSDG